MPHKQFAVADDISVTIYKRRSSRNLRLSIASDGGVRVSIPLWVPYRSGVQFARNRLDWIRQQYQPALIITDGQTIGKEHTVSFMPSISSRRTTSRVMSDKILIKFPAADPPDSTGIQSVAMTAAERALRKEAEKLLLPRVKLLAGRYDYHYASVRIKKLKSRWGSCDQHGNITLNLYLMQLPWECIDYVLLHELNHTKHLHHGDAFWDAMRQIVPNLTAIRKTMRTYRPVLQ